MLLNLDRHTTTSTSYLILFTNVADDTILKFIEGIDLNATIQIDRYILNIWFHPFIFFILFVHNTINKYALLLKIVQLRNLVYRICLHHDIAEILLRLALNTSQSIIPASFYFRCEASAKNNTNIERQVSTLIYIS